MSSTLAIDLTEEPIVSRIRTAAEIHRNAMRLLRYYRGRFYWRRDKANRVIKFFETQIVHIEGELAGETVVLERWQKRILRRAFGWFCHANAEQEIEEGQRKYRTVLVFIPRKNGKSVKGSGIGIFLTAFDGEMGAKVVAAAADTEQAGQIFDVSKQMVLRNPKLSSRIRPYRSTLVHYPSGSNYRILSSVADTKHGMNLSGIVFDELHAQPNRDLYDVLHTATGARLNPMEWFFTTAGHDRNSICYEQYKYALGVVDYYLSGCDPAYGISDDHFLPCLYYAEETDDWHSVETWRKANPNLGVSIKMHYLRTEYNKALLSPAYENTFKRLHLNMWTEQETRWIAVEHWRGCKTPCNEEELFGRDCWLGLDAATKIDLAAVVALFPFLDEEGATKRVVVRRWLFCPGDTIARRSREDRVPYETWVRMGHLIATPGTAIDHTRIRSTIQDEIAKRFNIVEIGADPWNAHQLLQDLTSDGFKVIELEQNARNLSDACKELEALVLSRRLEQDGCPALEWMFRNIAIRTDRNGNILLDKGRSQERIDGMAALVNALSRFVLLEKQGPSVYESRGLLTT